MEIATRITEEQAKKLAFIQDRTEQSLDEVLASAIDRYYEQVSLPKRDRLEKLSQLGFIGCIEADPDLAENSESILMQEIQVNEE